MVYSFNRTTTKNRRRSWLSQLGQDPHVFSADVRILGETCGCTSCIRQGPNKIVEWWTNTCSFVTVTSAWATDPSRSFKHPPVGPTKQQTKPLVRLANTCVIGNSALWTILELVNFPFVWQRTKWSVAPRAVFPLMSSALHQKAVRQIHNTKSRRKLCSC